MNLQSENIYTCVLDSDVPSFQYVKQEGGLYIFINWNNCQHIYNMDANMLHEFSKSCLTLKFILYGCVSLQLKY